MNNLGDAQAHPEEYWQQFAEYKSYYGGSVRWDDIKYFRIHKHKDKWTELFQHMKNQFDFDNQYNTVTAESMTNSLGPNFFTPIVNYNTAFDGNKLDFCMTVLSPILNHISGEVPGHNLNVERLEQQSREWINENKETSHVAPHGNPSHPNSMTCGDLFFAKAGGQIDDNTGLPSEYIVHPGNWSNSNAFNGGGGGFVLNAPFPQSDENQNYVYVHPGSFLDANKPLRYGGNEMPQHLVGLHCNPLRQFLHGPHQQPNEPVKIQGPAPQSGGKRRKIRRKTRRKIRRKTRRKIRRKRGKRKSKRGGEYSKYAKKAIKNNASKYPKIYASTKETYDPITLLNKNRKFPSYPSKHPGKGGRRTKRRRTKRRRTRRRK
jgi:hypothetical protein